MRNSVQRKEFLGAEMAEDISGRGDIIRGLELMWGRPSPSRRGPRTESRTSDLVAAAIRIADAEGIKAVSTRRVAEAAGISAMSFYTHIPDKAVLLDLMLDAIANQGESVDRPSEFNPAAWRANIGLLAHQFRAFLLRHPWVLQVSTHRPGVGPNAIRSYDHFLAAFDQLGLDEVEMDLSVAMITQYVQGAVRDVARARMVETETGMSDQEWWQIIAPFLSSVDLSVYPVANRVGPVAGELYGAGDPERAFAFGLERLLDGLGMLIETKRTSAKD